MSFVHPNRREFLGAMAVAGASQTAKLKFGIIGCGWYGMVDCGAAFKAGGVECIAVCDVDSDHLSQAALEVEKAQGSKPKAFKLYQELLDTPGLDAVIIATPPQWHALPFIAACKKGLAIYEEKPLAYDIREGRAMVSAAKKAGNIVQVGFQRRQSDCFRAAADYIRQGNAGRIVQVDVNIHYQAATPDPTPKAPPPSLDWDLWCGPGTETHYSEAIGHKNWRLEETTGNGHLVDWGIHLIDAIRVTLGETTPKWVEAMGGLYEYRGKITTPDTLTAHFEFAKCPVVWRHRLWGAAEYSPETSNGIFFFGDKETVFASDSRWTVIPRAKGGQRRVMDVKSDAGLRHMQEFLECVRAKRQPSCQPEDAFFSAATVQLAMISYKTGGRVVWDSAKEQIVNNPAAAKLLKRPYRPPYKHPYEG